MALILSAASGNFNAGATWVGGVVPTVGDEAQAATGHTITITANVTCDLVSNTGTGIFTLNDGVTLTANVTNKSTTTSRNCLQFTAVSPATASIVGNCTGGTVASAIGANNTSTGTLAITGNVTSGSGGSSNGATNSGTGTITITGNVTAGTGANGAQNASSGTLTITGNVAASSTANVHGANNNSTGTLNIIGNATGSSGTNAHGAINSGTGTITITGNATGGSVATSYGANNNSTGTLNIIGNATGGSVSGATGANNAAAGVIAITGNATGGVSGPGVTNASNGSVTATRAVGNAFGLGSVGLTAATGIANSGNAGVVEVRELEYGLRGMSPVTGFVRLKKDSLNQAIFNWVDSGSAKILVDGTQGQMPAATDVRSGVSYASGALTGSCAVPAAGSVALGVPVDATTGTAVLTPEAVWGASTRTLTAGAGISASDVWAYNSRTLTTSSGPTAVEIRQEIDANSTKLDATVSSRLASSAYTAPTTPPTAAQIATAVEGSLLNEVDGQQVLNAIVGAIGNTNLSEVSLVAAIRSDIERAGGKLDSVPTAAANASAVWGTATKQITGGTVDTLTNSPSVPSAASIASATRTELAVELARVDASVSSRLAASESSKLDAVKAKTDALNTERLANVATTAIVGNLIAQANS